MWRLEVIRQYKGRESRNCLHDDSETTVHRLALNCSLRASSEFRAVLLEHGLSEQESKRDREGSRSRKRVDILKGWATSQLMRSSKSSPSPSSPLMLFQTLKRLVQQRQIFSMRSGLRGGGRRRRPSSSSSSS